MSTRGGVTASANNVFVFDTELSDVGDAYDPATGTFTAPFPGLYVFHFNLIDHSNRPTIHVALVRNGRRLVAATMEGGSNTFDAGTAATVVRLAPGDRVNVQRYYGGNEVNGGEFCNFSGFLVSADA